MDKFEEFTRRTFTVRAIQVTEENIADLASYVKTVVRIDEKRWGDRQHFLILTVSPENASRGVQMSPVFIGDWLTESDKGFQRYVDNRFHITFEKKPSDDEKRAKVLNFLQEQDDTGFYSLPNLDWFTEQIMKIIE